MPILRADTSYRLTGGGRLAQYYDTYSGAYISPCPFTRVVQPGPSTGWDTHLNSATATTANYQSVQFAIGESNVDTNNGTGLIKPPLDQLSAYVLSFTAVYLDLTITVDRSSNTRNYDITRVLQNWVLSQATWNVYSTGNNWATAGCNSAGVDYDATVLATHSMTGTETVGSVHRWSINPTVVYSMYNGTYPNYGFRIKPDTYLNDEWIFASCDYTTDPLARPKWTFETIEAVA